MKKPVSTLCIAATLAMSFNSSAQADWGRHDRGYRDYQPMHHQHRGGSGWSWSRGHSRYRWPRYRLSCRITKLLCPRTSL